MPINTLCVCYHSIDTFYCVLLNKKRLKKSICI